MVGIISQLCLCKPRDFLSLKIIPERSRRETNENLQLVVSSQWFTLILSDYDYSQYYFVIFTYIYISDFYIARAYHIKAKRVTI